MESQLKKNDEIEVYIDRYGANGEGIATKDGKIIFVPFACKGERVLAKIVADKKSYYYAKLLKVLEASPDRREPRCPYFFKCGGCDLQHINYEKTLEIKRDIIRDAFLKYAGIDASVSEVVKSPNEYRYRNKFAFPVSENKDGKIVIGMYRKNSHDIVELDDCFLQHETAGKIIHLFKQYMEENKISAYSETTKRGTIKHIVVRENENSFILTIVVTDKNFKNFSPLIQKLNVHFNNYGIVKNVNNLKNNVIFGNFNEKIYGIAELEKNEFGIKYFVSNTSFLQVNDDVKNLIYKKIIELVEGSKIVIDAYSGAGLLSSIIAKHAQKVYGIEIVESATADAEKLKKLNNLNNLININGDCAECLPKLAAKINDDFTVVIDPPRKGVDESVLQAILSSEPSKIIYLSCNPSTLARDVKTLSEKYSIKLIQPYDMFPQTANVETLVLLKLRSQ